MILSNLSEGFKNSMPEELMETATVDFQYSSYLKMVINNLKLIYGDYADPEYCMKSYYSSIEYNDNCQNVINRRSPIYCDDMDIRNMMEKDDEYRKIADEVVDLYNSPDREKRDNIIKRAYLLGVYPEENPDAIYQNMVAKRDMSCEEKEDFKRKIESNLNIMSIITDQLSILLIDGFMFEIKGKGSIISQPKGKCFYRGENAYYGKSVAGIYRNDIKKDEAVHYIADWLRYLEFGKMLLELEAVLKWDYCSVNPVALAQHYGIRTQMMDVTTNFKTALFFACCKYGDDGKWHPLNKNDFQYIDSRKHIYNMGGDSRFGMIYCSPTDIVDLSMLTDKDEINISPIGYQPFMRCSQQYGYMLNTSDSYDLYKDKRFNKYIFRLNEGICNWIYNEMEQGNLVYPNDDIPDISDEVDRINNGSTFSKDSFDGMAEHFECTPEEKEGLYHKLRKYGYNLIDEHKIISDERIEEINETYSVDSVIKNNKVKPIYRPMFHIGTPRR